jgi:aryl-alcohol dehydrogenase-like predicted oxidoreductase
MKYVALGHSGLKVSRVALGSWLTFGSSERADTDGCVARAVELGVNFLDTADVYAKGEAERALAVAIKGRRREHLVLATKCFWPMSDDINDRGLSRKHVSESVRGSLRRLGTDYIDLFQCHRFDEETPLEETVRVMGDLIRRGDILHWGVSVWTADQIEAACQIADGLGVPRPISNQPEYSLLARGIERDVVPASRRLGLSQVVFSPLAQGVLSGKYAAGRPEGSRGADPKRGVWMTGYLRPDVLRRVEGLAAIAAELSVPTAALALAWCLRDDAVASAIVGATSPAQVDENVRAAEIVLDGALRARIEGLFPG